MNKQQFLEKLGKRIVSIREERSMSQAELARACSKDAQSIERVENAKTNPTAYYLYEVSKALNVNVKDLLDVE